MVSSAFVLVAANTQAGVFNRPDILDVNDGSTYLYDGDYDTRVGAYMRASSYSDDVYGYMFGSARDANNAVVLFVNLYQPDKVSRNHRRAKADQKHYTWIGMALYTAAYGSTVARHSGAIEDCKSSLSADDRDRDGDFDVTTTSDDRIRGKLRCHKDTLEELGFGPNEIDAIEAIIGNRTKLTIRLPQ
jgi:hypothetical protein